MPLNKESELTGAILAYAMRCLVEGDQLSLRQLNFGPKEIEALKTLTLADLYRIDALKAHCLEITLDRKAFWPMIEHLVAQRESEVLQQQLIQEDAPFEMMHQLFGIGAREYTRWRRLLALSPSVGRPAEISEEDNHRLWYAYQDCLKEKREHIADPEPVLTSNDYLAISQETGISLRAIWVLIERWVEDGAVSLENDVDHLEPLN